MTATANGRRSFALKLPIPLSLGLPSGIGVWRIVRVVSLTCGMRQVPRQIGLSRSGGSDDPVVDRVPLPLRRVEVEDSQAEIRGQSDVLRLAIVDSSAGADVHGEQ